MEENRTAIDHIRSFNRFYTNLLGLLDRHILDSDFSLTEARVLLEINKSTPCNANALVRKLDIDRGYVSRLLKGFEAKGFLTKRTAAQDGRFHDIELTEAGLCTVRELEERSREQISRLIAGLSPEELATIQQAMDLLRGKFSRTASPVILRDGTPADIPYMIRRHQELYREEHHFTDVFADYVKQGVIHLAKNLDPSKECILVPEIDGQPMGSIAIARLDDDTAQLRYFLLEPQARGRGLGHRLVEAALDFCRGAGYRRMILYTVSSLLAARSIYKNHGFVLTQTHPNHDWGADVLEERWELDLTTPQI